MRTLTVLVALAVGWHAPYGTPVAVLALLACLSVLGAFAAAPLVRAHHRGRARLEVASNASVMRAVNRAHRAGGAR